MAKRKWSSAAHIQPPSQISPSLLPETLLQREPIPPPIRRTSTRVASQPKPAKVDPNPNTNPKVVDGQEALRASPDAEDLRDEGYERSEVVPKRAKKSSGTTMPKPKAKVSPSESSLSDLSDVESRVDSQQKPSVNLKKTAPKEEQPADPEADVDEDADPEEIAEALSRPPPVNSSYLPLPWKGRLGYACLCTYLRNSNPPVFTSRTCRIASILEHRHPLKDPLQPEHVTKNRPDKDQPADVTRGQAYVEGLALANVHDLAKMLRWNDRYGIKFMRLSSEMFPFASHDVYGYRLAPFASEALARVGRVAAELGHRLTTHPGQFTQLGSPRKEVIKASVRDLEYHDELLSLLKLPEQQNKDAVMILHMGGIYGDKAATLDRFRENYAQLSQSIKNRLVLENDDVCYSVHDLLPICEELNIPMVLDYHHHNIIFDADQIREGTLDIMEVYDRIKATWTRKGITQKMHYSEPTPSAITGRQRRKHNPRVTCLPPCPADMDLMIEAKDKEQAVFELMKTYKLPGFDTFNDILPYTRNDENKPWKAPKKKTPRKKKGQDLGEIEPEPEAVPPPMIPEVAVGMGGPEGRVYWPVGMEEWLRPKKREIKKKDPDATPAKAKTAGSKKIVDDDAVSVKAEETGTAPTVQMTNTMPVMAVTPKTAKKATVTKKRKKTAKPVPTPSTSDAEESGKSDKDDGTTPDPQDDAEIGVPDSKKTSAPPSRRQNGRGAKKANVSYVEEKDDDDD